MYAHKICPKCKKSIGKEGSIYECNEDKELYHKDCGGLNEKEASIVNAAAEAEISRKGAA